VIKSTRVRSRRRYAAAFTALCGLAIPAWWLALFQLPAFRRIFIPVAAWPYFKSVVWFDMSLALLTLTVALQAATGRPAPLLVLAGWSAWVAATTYSVVWAVTVGAPLLGPGLMIVALIGLSVAWHELVSPRAPHR